jgi:ATP-dependent Clp protease protease subunit
MSENARGYYDFTIELSPDFLDKCEGLYDVFYLQDLKQRKLFLDDEVSPLSVGELVKHIMQINAEDRGIEPEQRKPILLYIASPGGSVDDGFELIDTISSSKTPVYTINLGYQYSMGFLIGLAGHKRFASQNAKFLMHDGSHFIYNSTAKAHDQMMFQHKVEERVKSYVLAKSKISAEEYDSKLRVEWYMFADEAKEKGFVDYIIGQDCDIDSIV